jgi:MSHA biogenesis protein MshG
MPSFSYRGRSARGDVVTGLIEAATADAVASQLLSSGITPVDILPGRGGEGTVRNLARRLFARPPDVSELLLFGRQMYTLMKAGVPITRAMSGLVESTRNPILAETLKDVQINLESGRDLASSLARHPRVFPALMVSMVRVGETTGRLDEAFLHISRYLEADKDTRARVKTAIRYPIVVLVAIGVAMAVMNVFVIPEFAKLFASQDLELPWQTRLIVAVSDFSVAFWPVILGGLVLAIVGLRLYVNTETGRYAWDRFKLRIPIVGGILHRALMARFSRAFAIALRAGVPLVQALGVVARAVGNEYVGEHVQSMRNGIERGESLTRVAVTTGLFTPVVLQMLAVGEETGGVDELLTEVADFYEREVDYELKYLGDAIQPVLLSVIGAMVLILMLGIVLPVWDLAANIR